MNYPRASGLHRQLLVRFHQLRTGGVLRRDLFHSLSQLVLKNCRRTEEIHPFDVKYGTDTSGVVQPWDLGLPTNRMLHAVQYGAAIVDVFLDILRNAPVRYEDFVFVDLGSGKGRALLLASFFPFKKIVGVELSKPMHEAACRNIRLFHDEEQRCFDIESVSEDVATYSLPPEKLLVYLFNPFDQEIVRAVLANVERSLRESPRTIYIAYLKAVHRNVFDHSRAFHVYRETDRYVLYESGATRDKADLEMSAQRFSL